ncbi:HAD family hydrolase [Thalassococcus sp. BH17M4-6]|uniref:HAD family hydrolase n=1 Tax=Thalassococcus sp. BH17M4-6 TaxID=3413148 RepID=UPI003BD03605
MTPALIVWDFDGVLNANVVQGRFVWADRLQADLGIDPKAFSSALFGSGVARRVMRGQIDLRKFVADWLAAQGHDLSAEAFLDYWFTRDVHPDAQVLGWLTAHPARHVIGTNNERHRAAFIEGPMGFGARVDHIFASGRMGVAKPDPGFFAQIERWAGLPPRDILLIDDTAANIAACTARGWRGFHFTDQTRADLPRVLGLA